MVLKEKRLLHPGIVWRDHSGTTDLLQTIQLFCVQDLSFGFKKVSACSVEIEPHVSKIDCSPMQRNPSKPAS